MQTQAEQDFTPAGANPMLDGFVEITRPPEISWLPETLGWQILLFIFALFIMYRGYLIFKRYMDNAYRRWAGQQLSQLTESTEDIQKLPVLLKRTALYAYQRSDVADLTGQDWESWLDKECAKTNFSKAPLTGVLNQISYNPTSQITTEQFKQLKQQMHNWIKFHKGAL